MSTGEISFVFCAVFLYNENTVKTAPLDKFPISTIIVDITIIINTKDYENA